VLVAFGLGMAAATVEVAVRVLHLEPDRFWEPDPLVGSRHIAGKSGWWTQEDREFVVPIDINSEGWRDVERPVDKPAGTLRVLVLGDSFAEALQVPLEETFPRLLEGALNKESGSRVEVLNTGTSGFGTAGELLLLKREGPRYRPDVIVLAFFPGNDVMNNSPELETILVPVYGEDGTLVRVTSTKQDLRKSERSLWNRLLGYSKAVQYGRRQLATLPQLADGLGIAVRKPEMAGDGVPTAFGVYTVADDRWQRAWEHTATLLEAMKAEAAGLGAKLIVAVVSSREEIYPDLWEETRRTYPAMQQGTWDVDGPRRRALELCQRLGIPVLELTSVLRQQANGERLHFPRDGHWTAAGHRLAAQAMANFLVKQRLLTKDTEERHEVH
jgi:hypothetical protein